MPFGRRRWAWFDLVCRDLACVVAARRGGGTSATSWGSQVRIVRFRLRLVLQAGAAEQVMERDPERAREVLRSIRATGRQAIDEMGTMLSLVRGEAESSRQPQPSLVDLEQLVATTREAGMHVDLTIEGLDSMWRRKSSERGAARPAANAMRDEHSRARRCMNEHQAQSPQTPEPRVQTTRGS